MTADELRYVSYARDYGEPFLLARSVRIAAKQDLPLRVLSYRRWQDYRTALAARTFATIWSTHGLEPSSRTREDVWEFSDLSRADNAERLWRTIPEAFGADFVFGAQILLVMACNVHRAVTWADHMRPGSFVIAGRSVVTQENCADSVQRFLEAAHDLQSGPLTLARLKRVWGSSLFDVIAV